MTTTTKSVTTQRISAWRAASVEAGDYEMAATCDIAIGDDWIDGDDWTALSRSSVRRLSDMTRDEAIAAVVVAMNDNERTNHTL